jgi:hypothetical protein
MQGWLKNYPKSKKNTKENDFLQIVTYNMIIFIFLTDVYQHMCLLGLNVWIYPKLDV